MKMLFRVLTFFSVFFALLVGTPLVWAASEPGVYTVNIDLVYPDGSIEEGSTEVPISLKADANEVAKIREYLLTHPEEVGFATQPLNGEEWDVLVKPSPRQTVKKTIASIQETWMNRSLTGLARGLAVTFADTAQSVSYGVAKRMAMAPQSFFSLEDGIWQIALTVGAASGVTSFFNEELQAFLKNPWFTRKLSQSHLGKRLQVDPFAAHPNLRTRMIQSVEEMVRSMAYEVLYITVVNGAVVIWGQMATGSSSNPFEFVGKVLLAAGAGLIGQGSGEIGIAGITQRLRNSAERANQHSRSIWVQRISNIVVMGLSVATTVGGQLGILRGDPSAKLWLSGVTVFGVAIWSIDKFSSWFANQYQKSRLWWSGRESAFSKDFSGAPCESLF